MINYDDLVGIPVPNEDKTKLKFISNKSSIWDANIICNIFNLKVFRMSMSRTKC